MNNIINLQEYKESRLKERVRVTTRAYKALEGVRITVEARERKKILYKLG